MMTTATRALTPIPVFDRVKGCCNEVAPPLLHILAAAPEPVCVCDFTAAFDLGQPTISHHLARLREAGIVTSFKRGIWAFYQLDPGMSQAARSAIELLR
jgi:ArsR family transcriptional regulator, arsenate/arsenite/antimonite-responsive transcriptional repressor